MLLHLPYLAKLAAPPLYPGKLADESVELDLEYLERVLGIKVEKNEVNRIFSDEVVLAFCPLDAGIAYF